MKIIFKIHFSYRSIHSRTFTITVYVVKRIMILSIFVSINIFTRLILFAFAQNFPHSDGDYTFLYPKICLGINVLDSEFVLPYFMGMVEDFRYPKDQIYIKFFCEENGSTVISRWIEHFPKNLYRSIESTAIYKHENWREEAIVFGRRKSCAFVLLADTGTFLLRDSLRQMTSLDKIVVSPLLHSPIGTYSNAQALMLDEQFLHRNKLGFIRVYYSNGPLLINLKNSDSSYLTFEADNLPNYAGERRPIDVFASSAYSMDIPILFSNHFHYGYFLDSAFHSRKEHLALFSTFLASWFSEPASMPFPVSVALEPWYPVATKFGFDEIYMINLDRRPERLEKMREVLRLVGLQFTRMPAVDGYNLTRQQYSTLKFLPDYLDPYHKRPMKLGEIGCFLSHYKVWESIVLNGHQRAIVLEDDVRFTLNGTLILNGMVEDLMKTRLDWDLIYLGRKKMTRAGDEFYMQGHRFLSTVAYSYWTLGYAISLDGAKKLLAARPLQRLLALDEFLPIMYNQHPNPSWSGRFETRNLHAFALYPMAVQPERYTHEPGYVSDTEASPVVDLHIQQQNFLDEIQPNLEVERATTFGKEDL